MTLHTGRFCSLMMSAMLLIIVSCERTGSFEAQPEEGMGKIVLKSAETISEIEDYNFRFVGVNGYGTSPYYKFSEVSWPMEWYYGVFRLQAETCTVDEAEDGYGKLRYEGIGEPFLIINGQIATASVVCNVANVSVSVNFDDKMYEAFDGMKLTVNSVYAPLPTEDADGNVTETAPVTLRSLELDAINPTGFYNMLSDRVIIEYRLWVKLDGADEYLESVSGYYVEDGTDVPAPVHAGDVVTFNVTYTGEAIVTEHIKFVISGEKESLKNSISIGDYAQGTVTEDN